MNIKIPRKCDDLICQLFIYELLRQHLIKQNLFNVDTDYFPPDIW